MDGINENKVASFKYTELKFNIEDVTFSILYTHRFNSDDGIPVYEAVRELTPREERSGGALHFHKFCETFFFRTEGFFVSFEHREVPLEDGDILLVFPGVRHTANASSVHNATCLDFSYEKNALYRPHGLYDLLSQLSKNGYLHLKGFGNCLQAVNTLYEHLDSGNALMVARYFYDIITDILTASANLPHVCPKDMLYDTDVSRSRKIDAILSRYYTENITLEFMAKHLNLSVRQTSRVIRAYTGKTLGELVLAKRMKAAADYLSEGKLSVSDIASRVGYNSLPCFYLAFKKSFGCLPKEYKSRLQNDII